MKKLKFELAPQDEVEELSPYMDKVMKALGHSDALVTDESYISDFLDIFDEQRRCKQLEKAEKKLGIEIDSRDYVINVAKRLRDK